MEKCNCNNDCNTDPRTLFVCLCPCHYDNYKGGKMKGVTCWDCGKESEDLEKVKIALPPPDYGFIEVDMCEDCFWKTEDKLE